ncbi:uncharacterized protein YOR118W [Kluyveromyces marxianus]|nr:uncharacterized protein YOR118W [Kluyveromyces marxianus]
MGQSTSVQQEQRSDEYGIDHGSLVSYFNEKCIKQFTKAELLSFTNNIPEGRGLDDVVESSDISTLFHIPRDNTVLLSVFMNMFRTLANFPLIQESYDKVSFKTLLKSTLLLSKGRAAKYTEWKNFDELKMLFIALALEKSIKSESLPGSSSSSELRSSKAVIRSYNGVNVEELTINSNDLVHFFSFLLALSRKSIMNNCKIDDNALSKSFESFKQVAMIFVRTMDPTIISASDSLKSYITYEQFYELIHNIAPNLISPLNMLLEHTLYMTRDLVDADVLKPLENPSKIVTEPLLAQLATLFPKEIVFSRFQRLYVGRESGFSMRSFQSKVFKWMAPTILFIQGMRIRDEDSEMEENYVAKNPRYRGFLEEFGKLKNEDQHLDELIIKKRKVLYAVYIRDPWKVSNKELFGDSNTKIIQLQPTQEIYDAKPTSVGNVYFNTVGGGIGVGNQQPLIKPSSKKYLPGNISLTIDSSLEFGIFRHVGDGGLFSPGRLSKVRGEDRKSFEYRFLIQDVEVWGCGGEKELEEQVKLWQWEEMEAKRRQQINLQSMGEDRALLEMAGLVGQHQSGGSV